MCDDLGRQDPSRRRATRNKNRQPGMMRFFAMQMLRGPRPGCTKKLERGLSPSRPHRGVETMRTRGGKIVDRYEVALCVPAQRFPRVHVSIMRLTQRGDGAPFRMKNSSLG